MRVHTGDLHGNMSRIIEFIQKNQGKENCYLFVHGDAGINLLALYNVKMEISIL